MATAAGGLHTFRDSGIPPDSAGYTTLVLVHGYAWHGGIFTKMLPFAEKYNVRIVLLNRRDYPGSQPYSEEDLALLRPAADEEAQARAREEAWTFMRRRAAELYDWLATAVKDGTILPVDRETGTGGVIVAGWSFGTVWMTAFLAHGDLASAVHGVDLGSVVRRVVFYDPPYHALGYSYPEKLWNPLVDPANGPEEAVAKFAMWVSGYYRHGETPAELEYRVALEEPSPTLGRLTPEERATALCEAPGQPRGSDGMLFGTGLSTGLFERLAKAALYPARDDERAARDTWRDTEVRYIWCDHSVGDVPWGTWKLRAELDEAAQKGKRIRSVTMWRIRGANHFAHWDEPERALRALVSDAKDAEA
ncbi:hypothetical protein BD414DRAFT_468831 [Trametes punicea]|nr:hypothetical protein BD414DRAFT_468831 [Trametes punicea]